MAGHLLRESPGRRHADRGPIEFRDPVMDAPRRKSHVEVRQRLSMIHVGEASARSGLADHARAEPRARHDPRGECVVWPRDRGQPGHDVRVRAESSQHLDEARLELGRRIQHAVDAVGVVPPVAEGSVLPLRLPGWPRPRIGGGRATRSSRPGGLTPSRRFIVRQRRRVPRRRPRARPRRCHPREAAALASDRQAED